MKQSLVLTLLLALLPAAASAGPITPQKAQAAAEGFARQRGLAPSARLAKTLCHGTAATLYVFDLERGYVITSADDKVCPVIGFSDEGRPDWESMPENMRWFLASVSEEIACAAAATADGSARQQWDDLAAARPLPKSEVVVGPLLGDNEWSQGQYYNSLCPADPSAPASAGGHVQVGCGAMVMGQVMRYWEYPEHGMNSKRYNTSYGFLYANFANTTYRYDLMPPKLTASSTDEEVEAVATLLYHCGVAVGMNYGPTASVANSNNMMTALTNYFCYPETIEYHERGNISFNSWMSHLKAELDSLRPFFYGASGSYGGHVFVCDGYRDDNYLHLNWGWGGSYNGYFMVGDFTPGPYDFNSSHAVIVGIRAPQRPVDPAGTAEAGDTRLTVRPNPAGDWFVAEGEGFEAAALYDAKGALVRSGIRAGERVDISTLPGGIYCLRVIGRGTAACKTLVKH